MIENISNSLKKASQLKSFLSDEVTSVRFYDIVYVIADNEGFKKAMIESLDCTVTLAFTEKEIAKQHGDSIVAIMLGKLLEESKQEGNIGVVGINFDKSTNYFTQLLFVPFYDSLTKQYLISPPDEAIALLSINPMAHQHMGVQATFFSVNNKYMPDDQDAREKVLASLVEDINFIIPRISQPKGSANIICLLLNLDCAIEERAFIRKYKTNDPYTEVLFVTSDLKLQTGELEGIDYDGTNLEGVYTPIITRQKNVEL